MSNDPHYNSYTPGRMPVESVPAKLPIQGFTKVACIFFIILGGLGLFQTLQAVAGIILFMVAAGNAPGTVRINPYPGGMVGIILMSFVNFLVSIAEIVAGFFGLKQKRFGANLIRGISGFMLLFKLAETALGAISTYQSMGPAKDQIMKDLQSQPNAPPFDMGQFLEIGFYVAIGFVIVIGLAMFLFYLFTFLHFSKQRTLSQFN